MYKRQPESLLAAQLGDLDQLLGGASLAFLPSPSGVRLRITVHGRTAAEAEGTVRYGASMLELEVVDNGSGGAAPGSTPGHGLIGMRERVALYGGLLGQATHEGQPLPMHEATKLARRAIVDMPRGARSWGAYQHYGDPYYRMLA